VKDCKKHIKAATVLLFGHLLGPLVAQASECFPEEEIEEMCQLKGKPVSNANCSLRAGR
jgi:hypothetical protein